MRSLFTIVLISLLASGCATNPVTGRSELTLVSKREEISIGARQYLPAQQSQGGAYIVDEALTGYVNEVGQRLAAVSDRPLPYEFVVINDSTPNAWALPGGKIAINRGLLSQLDNEAELAAVLGHEIIHAAARHGAKAMERALLLQGAVLLTALGTQDSEYSNYIVGGASIGAQLISTRYGRQAELEADLYGMEYMARAGYDPDAAVSLQEKFVALKQGNSSGWLEGLFASHPPSQERVDRNAETGSQIKATQSRGWVKRTKRYSQRLAYLASRAEAYQAFDQATTLLENREMDVAMNRVNHAIRLEPREPRFSGLKADILFHRQSYRDAVKGYDAALERDDNYYEYYLGRGLSFSKLGNRDRARQDLTRSNSLLPTALATNELGNLSLADGDRVAAKRYFSEVAKTSGPLSVSARQSFVRLDLADNPAAYFKVRSERRDGRFYSTVTNAAGLDVSNVTVYFRARFNGKPRTAQRRIRFLGAGSSAGISPDWSISDTDVVDTVDVRVTNVSI